MSMNFVGYMTFMPTFTEDVITGIPDTFRNHPSITQNQNVQAQIDEIVNRLERIRLAIRAEDYEQLPEEVREEISLQADALSFDELLGDEKFLDSIRALADRDQPVDRDYYYDQVLPDLARTACKALNLAQAWREIPESIENKKIDHYPYQPQIVVCAGEWTWGDPPSGVDAQLLGKLVFIPDLGMELIGIE